MRSYEGKEGRPRSYEIVRDREIKGRARSTCNLVPFSSFLVCRMYGVMGVAEKGKKTKGKCSLLLSLHYVLVYSTYVYVCV